MSFWSGIGILGIILVIILVIICIWFGIITATMIATAIGATGWKWWVVSLTIFSALGGSGGSLIRIGKD